MHVLSTVHDAFSTRTRGKGYLGFRNAIRGIVVVCIVYLAVLEDFVCHRGKWLVFANCFLVDSWRWRETDDEVFEQSRNREIHCIRVSLFVFSILAGDRRKVKGFPTRLSVKIRDRIVGVFDTERTGGKTLKGKKKKKKKCGRSLTSAWECAWSWGRAIGRGCTLERIMKGKRELMGPRWPVPRFSVARLFCILSTACILLASTCYSFVRACSINRLFLTLSIIIKSSTFMQLLPDSFFMLLLTIKRL